MWWVCLNNYFYREERGNSFSQNCIHTERIWPPARAAPCRRSRWRSKPPRCCRWSPAPPAGRWAVPSAPATPPERHRQRPRRGRALKDVLEVSTSESSRHTGTQTEKVQNTELHHFRMKSTNKICFINVKEDTLKLRKTEKKLIQEKKRGKTPGTEQ